MVRQKVRWLLVHFELEEKTPKGSIQSESAKDKKESITAFDIFQAIRDCTSVSFGAVGMGSTSDAKGSYFNYTSLSISCYIYSITTNLHL